ncbi:hypothetical protein DACRYDRAFT_112745 [Dacryopinax primogenitus]|uniref:Uncharacterized protein n=1 Tax=Dacryopinax primogenitus (strain DJM 731) TaxID=1858805 RepID=M5FY37_DACPD|nr:uncharacterized protein DACRYDRAFT_112745 [Dacryopinax primogenitus]EJT96457.1 hypothetical protein DACRYDRAFT_112745 [Dacryopinax primogenitus]
MIRRPSVTRSALSQTKVLDNLVTHPNSSLYPPKAGAPAKTVNFWMTGANVSKVSADRPPS